jgi:hypothetical protein
VTGRPVFGDFLDAARDHLVAADQLHATARGDVDIRQVNRSMLRILILMRRYVLDVTPGWAPEPPQSRREVARWTRAGTETREALARAAAFLNDRDKPAREQHAAGGELARHLDAASASLLAGRDLLQTHLARDRGGERQLHSEWALAVTSPGVARAVLTEMRALARRLAPLGAGLALGPGSRGTRKERQKLNAACQWLWIVDASVAAAQRREPVRGSDLELLRAIPPRVPAPRRLPPPAESVAGLCRGVINSAERVRHLAWESSTRRASSPDLTVNSLRRVAATSTLTSHHCEILLRSLAERTAGHGPGDHAAWLLQAAEAAGRTRQRWLGVAHALDRVTTDTRLHLSPDAVESSDLALWTGRLAYADPEWTLASGPARPARPPEELAPRPGDARLVVTAVHHACETLTSLGNAEREQIRAAGAVHRILVTTRSLPDTMDIPRPFAPALPDRIESLVSACDRAGRSAEEATAQVATVAAAIGAASRVLTAAREAAEQARQGEPDRGDHARQMQEAADGLHFAGEHPELPGPVERALYDLGITSPDLLQRGADLDRASEQLITGAAADLEPRRFRPSAITLSRSAGTASLINHALASGDPRAASLLHGHAFAQRESPQAEP